MPADAGEKNVFRAFGAKSSHTAGNSKFTGVCTPFPRQGGPPERKRHLGSGLNQRDRGTRGFDHDQTHRKPDKKDDRGFSQRIYHYTTASALPRFSAGSRFHSHPGWCGVHSSPPSDAAASRDVNPSASSAGLQATAAVVCLAVHQLGTRTGKENCEPDLASSARVATELHRSCVIARDPVVVDRHVPHFVAVATTTTNSSRR